MSNNFAKLWLAKTLNANAIKRASEVVQKTGRALPCKVVAVNGSIVTVSFQVNSTPWTLPNITIPKAECNWYRQPTQVGDLGVTMPADVYIGGVSGLGGGVGDMTPAMNLSALIFMPISNANTPPEDPNAAIVQAPNGAIIQTIGGTTSKIVTDTSGTTITYGGTTIVVNASGVTINTTTATINASSTLAIVSPETTISGNLSVVGSITGTGGLGITGGAGVTATGDINLTGSMTASGDISAAGISLETHVHSGVTVGISNTGAPF